MLNTFRQILSRSSVILALFASATFAVNAAAEPPNRVGRVSLVEGNVSFFMDRSEGWKPARINFPVTSENSVWTEGASRAEIRIGASAVRVDDNSILDFIRIDDDQTQAFLQRGTISIRTRGYGRDDNDSVRNYLSVETNGGRFVIEKNGRYRIDVTQDGGESRISVYAGRARYEGTNTGESAVIVDRGRTLVAQGTRGSTNFRFETAAESAFDRWADARDRSWDQAHTRYVTSEIVSPYMTGYEDLDTYGDWIDNGEYGRVWAPRYVSTNWAPYRYGSWSYVSPWGWTWVDEAPWGFAPFHYGRWVTIGSRWCWWPGQYQRRPVYAPALVAWYGRPGLSVNVSVGEHVGWFPLAPREYYVPRYTNNVNYIRNVNYVTNNVTIINNNPPQRYQNQVPGATFVNQNVFVQSKPIAVNAIRETPANIATFKPLQVIDVPRPVVQGQPVLAGQPVQQGTNSNSANSVWARGRNNVAPVYAPAPQMQGQQVQQVQGQPQIQGGQIQQNQVPNRVGGAAIAGAAVAGAAVGAAGTAMINNGGNAANRAVAPTLNAPPQAIPPAPVAPVVNGAVVSNAKPLQGMPQPQTQAQPQPQAILPRVGGAPNAIPPVPAAAPVAPAPIAVQSTQRPPVVNQTAQPLLQQQQPQPSYAQQGAKPGVINGGEQNGQPRVRQNRGPESSDANVNPQVRPLREVPQQHIQQYAVPVQRQAQVAPPPRVQPQQQIQQIQQQQVQQQPRPQTHPQQQHAEKPQRAEKPLQVEKPAREGQGKPGQQQQ
jgi:hypothetical protein